MISKKVFFVKILLQKDHCHSYIHLQKIEKKTGNLTLLADITTYYYL